MTSEQEKWAEEKAKEVCAVGKYLIDNEHKNLILGAKQALLEALEKGMRDNWEDCQQSDLYASGFMHGEKKGKMEARDRAIEEVEKELIGEVHWKFVERIRNLKSKGGE